MDFNTPELEEKIRSAPTSPGCYIYKNKKGKILYIGKAINLKNRVLQYFRPSHYELGGSSFRSPKISQMVKLIRDVEYHVVDSEIEALILEANLIRKYKPPYNTMLKEGFKYAWIKITTKEAYPQVFATREKGNDKALYFGPYPNAGAVYSILKFLRKVFPYRTCYLPIPKDGEFTKSRLCFFYHLKLCTGPCDYLISTEEYRKNINNIIRFLKGEKLQVIRKMEEEMKVYAKERKYEQAAYLRDKVKELIYVSQRIGVEHDMDELNVEEKKNKEAAQGIKDLFDALGYKMSEKNRIECYDISNIQGSYSVGSMVVFENGFPKREDYRKFRIKNIEGPNDFASMQQVLERRLKYLIEEKKEKDDPSFMSVPDLLLIDGGKGQLGAVLKAQDNMGIHLQTASLAKREEELFLPNQPKSIKLKRDSFALFLVQRIRDETHRFGITYHRKIRGKGMLESRLHGIHGIGTKRKDMLLKKYKTFSNIQKASVEELMSIVKNKKAVKKLKDNDLN